MYDFQVLLSFVYMILYSIQWQASHNNRSCYANKVPASIWIMQIIKILYGITAIYRSYSFTTNSFCHLQLHIQK
jgi:hypothetical protein